MARLQLLAAAPIPIAAAFQPVRIAQERTAAGGDSGYGVIAVDDRGLICAFDQGAATMFRCSAQDMLGGSIQAVLEDPRRPGQPLCLRTGELQGRRPDHSVFSVRASVGELNLFGRSCTILSLLDTSGRRDSEAQLRETEARYRTLIEQIPAVTFSASLNGGVSKVYVSPQVEALLGFTQQEWIASPVLWFKQLHPDDRDLWNAEFARGCATGGPFRAECRFLSRDGTVVWVHGEARLVKDELGRPLFLQGIAFDITESKRAEELVRASLQEKEGLLKEIHHRVKNNLQVTSSLLELQSTRMSDDAARQMLRDSQDRIRSMALVHEMLYQSQDLARVDFGDYIPRLVRYLFRSYSVNQSCIACRTEVDAVSLGVDTAVPCGLIINELVSNSLKHAFPGNRKGELTVTMKRCAGSAYELTVADDGVGLPPGLEAETTDTLGLRIVRTLTQQIEGALEINTMPGRTEFRITFERGVEVG
ncbi:histidine kinase dimerization/phosphoacceptor domain -containing protein [Sorangium cellulosum]|nr:histidine kinase dimerization/phosphoacceptor domain -containing protein [Sorangium cellulosum]